MKKILIVLLASILWLSMIFAKDSSSSAISQSISKETTKDETSTVKNWSSVSSKATISTTSASSASTWSSSWSSGWYSAVYRNIDPQIVVKSSKAADITVKWDFGSAWNNQQYRVELQYYKMGSNTMTSLYSTRQWSGFSYTYNLTDLTASTKYYFKLKIYYVLSWDMTAGWWVVDYPSTYSFTTLSATPKVTYLYGSGITDQTTNLAAITVWLDQISQRVDVEYTIVATAKNVLISSSSFTDKKILTWSAREFKTTISNIKNGYTLYYRARGYIDWNAGTYSEIKSLSFKDTSPKVLAATWTVSVDTWWYSAKINVTFDQEIDKSEIIYSQNRADLEEVFPITVWAQKLSKKSSYTQVWYVINITGLKEGTYYYKIRGYKGGNAGNYSSVYTLRVKEPNPVFTWLSVSTTENWAKIIFSTVSESKAYYQYQVQYGTSSTSFKTSAIFIPNDWWKYQYSVSLSWLYPGTTYYYRIVWIYANSSSSVDNFYWPVKSFKTTEKLIKDEERWIYDLIYAKRLNEVTTMFKWLPNADVALTQWRSYLTSLIQKVTQEEDDLISSLKSIYWTVNIDYYNTSYEKAIRLYEIQKVALNAINSNLESIVTSYYARTTN